MQNSPRISVFTPTYNRANTLPRLFDSLKAQTFRDFEWVIVDDGSIDDTTKLVEEFKMQADFPINYIKKENGGKHSAINIALPLLKGEYVFEIDSDDVLLPNAMEVGLGYWESIPNPELYWTVCGRNIYHHTGKMVGKPLPDNINSVSPKQQNKLNKITGGDRCSLVRTEIWKQYPFPDIKGCHHIPESYVWKSIDCDYKQWFVNDTFAEVYLDSENQLTKIGSKNLYFSIYPSYIYYLHFANYIYRKSDAFSAKDLVDNIVHLCYSAVRCGIPLKEVLRKIQHTSDKMLASLLFPMLFLYGKLRKTAGSATKE